MLPAPTTPYMCACLIVYIKYFYVSKLGNTTNYEWSRIKKKQGNSFGKLHKITPLNSTSTSTGEL